MQPGGGFYTSRVLALQANQSNFTVNGGAAYSNASCWTEPQIRSLATDLFAFTPSVEAIQEFKVLTANYSAEYGRTGGGIVTIVTKSGTNELHGTAYEFLRNSAFDANNVFNNRAGVARAPFRFNQFGLTAGGPVLLPRVYNGRNRTFWFFGYGRFDHHFSARNQVFLRVSQLKNGFREGLLQPPGKSGGLETLLGQNIRGDLRNLRVGYMQQWSLNLQREIHGLLIEAGYAGSRGVKLPISFALNPLPDQYLSLGPALIAQTANPFFGIINSGSLASSTVQRGQLLRPFPQFGNVNFGSREAGASTYHSLQARAQRRFSHGLTL